MLGSSFSFWTAWLYGYALWFGINLWDLVVLDWGASPSSTHKTRPYRVPRGQQAGVITGSTLSGS